MARLTDVALAMLVGAFGLGQPALAAGGISIAVPLAADAAVEKRAPDSLVLRVTGDGQYFDVSVTSRGRVRGCPINLVHWAAHGPDPSEVMPWQVTSRHFPDQRSIPVCGHALTLHVSLVAAATTGDGERFAAGTLIATLSADK